MDFFQKNLSAMLIIIQTQRPLGCSQGLISKIPHQNWAYENKLVINLKHLFRLDDSLRYSQFLCKLEKSFQKKTIVSFTNSSVWSHVLALSAWTLKEAHIVSCQDVCAQITNIYMQGKFLTN